MTTAAKYSESAAKQQQQNTEVLKSQARISSNNLTSVLTSSISNNQKIQQPSNKFSNRNPEQFNKMNQEQTNEEENLETIRREALLTKVLISKKRHQDHLQQEEDTANKDSKSRNP